MRNIRKVLNKSSRLLEVFFFFCGLCMNVAAQDVVVFPQMGHLTSISSLPFSPDGKQVLSGADKTILWDTDSGREIRTFSGHTGGVASVAFSPDGKQILSGSWDSTIKLWDVNTGREIKTFSGHTEYILSVAYSPDGKQILSGSSDKTIKLWNVNTGREIRTFSGHTGGVASVAFSPDGKQILSGSWDSTIKLWDVNTGREIRTFSGHTGDIRSVAFSPDGKQILSSPNDKIIKLWDVNTGREIRTFSGHTGDIRSVAFSPDGKQILSGSLDGSVMLWDVNNGNEIKKIILIEEEVNSVTFNHEGNQVLFSSLDKTIKLWDINTEKEIKSFSGNRSVSLLDIEYHSSILNSVKFRPDGKQFISSIFSDNTIKLWDINTGKVIKFFLNSSGGNVTSSSFSPDGEQIVSGSWHGSIKLWDVNTGNEIKTFSNNTDGWFGTVVSFTPDGKQIISCSERDSKLWDVNTGNEIKTFSRISGIIMSIPFSPDGRHILTGSYDGSVKLWDVNTEDEIWTFSGHTGSVLSVAFSPDGRRILSGSSDGTMKLWDINTKREIWTFSNHQDESFIMTVAFSPDGKQVLSGSWNGLMKLWNVDTGREIRTFHTPLVGSVTFSPDGRHILSNSLDGTVRLWDVSTGKEIAHFIDFNDNEWVVITPDGYYNASPNGDKYLNVRVGNNVYGIDQFRNIFYRPQIVEARLQGKPDPVRVTTTIQDAASFVPPDVVIMRPEKGTTLSSNQVELAVTVIDQRQPIKTIKVQVNGRPVAGETLRGGISGINRGELELETTQIRLIGNQNRVEFRLPVNLDPGANRIEVIATNPYSESNKEAVDVNYKQSSTEQNILPNLWILSIGINRYDSPLLQNLDYAVNDAREIINVFKSQEGKLYRKVNYKLIADGEKDTPIRDNIVDNFAFLKQASQRDVVLLFIAGHGQNDENGFFYFMPSDAAFYDDGSIRPSKAISYRDIQSVLDVKGQKLVFIDSCHSEGVSGKSTKTRGGDTNQLVRALQDNSTVIFTASRGGEQSKELKELKHGVFTYAIIQGMRGEADMTIGGSKDGQVTMKELDTYVSEMVPILTNKSQHPTTITPDGYTNFVVAELE